MQRWSVRSKSSTTSKCSYPFDDLIDCLHVVLCSYVEYAAPMLDTYNNVVGNTLSLLNNMSLDERARRWKEENIRNKVESPKQPGQFEALKRHKQTTMKEVI